MTDMTAFERQLSGEITGLMGPIRPVDDLAIFESVTAASRSQGWGFTMFSALKFIAAAAIVALFGGFLIAGVLTTQQPDKMAPAAVTESPAPNTTEGLLSGMVTKEVWPGVFRVASDGVRDFTTVEAVDIVAGYDGGIWLRRSEEGLVRLGSDGSHPWPLGSPEDHVFEVAPDGTMWAITGSLSSREGAGLRTTDGEVWMSQPCPGICKGVTVALDGTVWASWQEENGRWRTGHLGPMGWEPVGGDGPPFGRFFFTDAGDVYGYLCDYVCWLLRYEDGVWQDAQFYAQYLVDVAPDGTVWRDAGGCLGQEPAMPCGQDGLARFAGGEWAEWTSADLFADNVGFGLDHEFKTAPDGSLWFSLWQSADGSALPRDGKSWTWEAVGDGRLLYHLAPGSEDAPIVVDVGGTMDAHTLAECDGLARFDGTTVDHFLPGQCISMDIAADGSVWVLADEDEGRDLYVITPEAVAATS